MKQSPQQCRKAGAVCATKERGKHQEAERASYKVFYTSVDHYVSAVLCFPTYQGARWSCGEQIVKEDLDSRTAKHPTKAESSD